VGGQPRHWLRYDEGMVPYHLCENNVAEQI
jgi:hypothetical protein